MLISTKGALNLETCVLVQLISEVALAQPNFFRDRPTLTIVQTSFLYIEKVGISLLLQASIRGLKSRLDVSPEVTSPCVVLIFSIGSPSKAPTSLVFQCQPLALCPTLKSSAPA